jgi:acetone carboxylase beta subunit
MLESEAKETLRRTVSARGFAPSEYVLLAYGGAGPLHVAGYSNGLGFKEVLTFPYAACFSAFGCTTADYSHRYSRSVHVQLPADQARDERDAIAKDLDAAWEELSGQAIQDMVREGKSSRNVTVTFVASVRYIGQLEDVEVLFPAREVADAEGIQRMIGAWEAEYDRINRRVSRYSEAGHQISDVGVIASAPKIKPRLVPSPLREPEPVEEARRPMRQIYWEGEWHEATVWDIESLRPGNAIVGPAVLEHPATTFVVPPAMRTWLDEMTIFHLAETGAS